MRSSGAGNWVACATRIRIISAALIGAGANFKVTENMRIRGEFEWFDISETELVWTAGFSLIVGF